MNQARLMSLPAPNIPSHKCRPGLRRIHSELRAAMSIEDQDRFREMDGGKSDLSCGRVPPPITARITAQTNDRPGSRVLDQARTFHIALSSQRRLCPPHTDGNTDRRHPVASPR